MKNERKNLKQDPWVRMEEQLQELRDYQLLKRTSSWTTRRKKGREDWKGSRSKTPRRRGRSKNSSKEEDCF